MKRAAIILAVMTLALGPAATSPCGSAAFASARCCKMCKAGKACGNSCISKSKNCHQPPGCACNG